VNSQQLLYINIILGGLFLLYFIFGRSPPKAPTRLNLKNKDTAGLIDDANAQSANQIDKTPQTLLNSKVTLLEPETENKAPKNTQKDLAVFFVYNGHDWEAHHVLGVAQGSNIKVVTEEYQKMLARTDSKSYDFLEAAYKALLQSKSKDRL
jgi:hypothetical protein